jgi:outer membrane protein assembly factor BamB
MPVSIGGASPAPPTPQPWALAQQWMWPWQGKYVVWMSVVGVVMVAGIGLINFFATARQRPVASSARSSTPRWDPPLTSATPPPLAKFSFVDPPMLVDADDDGVDDLVGGCCDVADPSNCWIGAFSGVDGRLLWQSETIALAAPGLRAVAGNLVVATDSLGKVRAFDAAKGGSLWTLALGEVPKLACASSDFVGITTTDGTFHALALASGKTPDASSLREACEPVYNTGLGEAPNFQLENKLTKKNARGREVAQEIAGMSIRTVLVPTSGAARVAIGNKARGSEVPMVAVVARGKLLWQSPVPAVNPLNTESTAWHQAAVRRGRIVIPYSEKDPRRGRLTCFDLGSGRRQWDIALADTNDGNRRIAVSRDGQVFVSLHAGTVGVYTLDDGGYRFSIGEP